MLICLTWGEVVRATSVPSMPRTIGSTWLNTSILQLDMFLGRTRKFRDSALPVNRVLGGSFTPSASLRPSPLASVDPLPGNVPGNVPQSSIVCRFFCDMVHIQASGSPGCASFRFSIHIPRRIYPSWTCLPVDHPVLNIIIFGTCLWSIIHLWLFSRSPHPSKRAHHVHILC